MIEIVVALAIGVAAGVAGGLFGIGGGIIIVPCLIYFMQFTQHRAQGTSLVALLAPVGAAALYNYWKDGNADIRIGAFIAGGFVVGAIFGSRFALSLDPLTMKRTFAVFLIVVGVYTLFRK